MRRDFGYCVYSAHTNIPSATTTTTTTSAATTRTKIKNNNIKINHFVTSSAAKYLCLLFFSRQLKMGVNESNAKASSESSSLLGEESFALGRLPSRGTSRQYPESGLSSSTQNVPHQEEIIEVDSYDEVYSQIFWALLCGDPTELSNLLTKYKTDVNSFYSKGNTALHLAVATACREDDRDEGLYQCINLLMSCEQMKVNMPNKKGYTAIGLAVHKRHKTCVEYMLKRPSADRLYLDYYPRDSESTLRDIILEIYPDLEPLLPPPRLESLDSSERDIKLLAALQHDEYKIFIKTFDSNNPNPWYDEPYHSSLLEIACQMKNRKRFVEPLLNSGADPNTKNSVTGMPLIIATARSGNLELLEILLNKKTIDVTVKDSEQRTIFHWLATIREKNPNEKKLENCFVLLQDFFKNGRIKDQGSSELFGTESASKSILEAMLDYCFNSNKEPTESEKFEVTLKFHPLSNMTYLALDARHNDLFKHPVMSVFLNLLWKKLKILFFFNVALYVTFLLSLTTYILFSEFCNTQNNRYVANNTNGFLSHNDSNVTCGMSDERRYNISQGLWYTLMILWGLLCVREGCQLIAYRKKYIMSLENCLELLLLFVTFTSCSGIVVSIEVNRHLFAIAILLGWFELVLILGRLPLLSVETEMLKKVSLTFLRFMAGYSVLILAFAFSFFILFEENVKVGDAVLFTNPLISILRTIVMLAGEFEVSSLPFDILPGTSHVIFLLFVLFVAIVLLNLLQGLAVGDTNMVREEAETLSLVARVRLITYLREVYLALPYFKTYYLTLENEYYVLFPNKEKNISSTELRSLQRIINEKRKRNKKEKKTEHVENWKLSAEEQSTLQLQCDEMQQMLKKILTHLNISEP